LRARHIQSKVATNTSQKYHSIHKSGKRLEDALSAEELKKLREYVDSSVPHFPSLTIYFRDYGEYLEETETPFAATETNGHADLQDTEMIHADVNDIEAVIPQQQVHPRALP
jgi:hypothetical protein